MPNEYQTAYPYHGYSYLGVDSNTHLVMGCCRSTHLNLGGGVYVDENPEIIGNTFSGNTAYAGGGLFFNQSNARLTNNLVVDNQAEFGSGMAIGESSPHLLHNTITHNLGKSGVGIYLSSGTVTLTNPIIVSHTVGIWAAQGTTATLEATLWSSGAWSNVTNLGGPGAITTGVNNFTGLPDFVDYLAGDYRIDPNSDAIDHGMDVGVKNDFENQPRPYLAPDIGADEYWPPGVLKYIFLPVIQH